MLKFTMLDRVCEDCYNVEKMQGEGHVVRLLLVGSSYERCRNLYDVKRTLIGRQHWTTLKSVPSTNPDASLQGDAKALYVTGMFSRIARRYDLMNFIMSLGQDRAWRRFTVRQAYSEGGGLALDVATGTGRIAQELARTGTRAVGVDFTLSMMEQGRADGVGEKESVYFAGADALSLPFGHNTFTV